MFSSQKISKAIQLGLSQIDMNRSSKKEIWPENSSKTFFCQDLSPLSQKNSKACFRNSFLQSKYASPNYSQPGVTKTNRQTQPLQPLNYLRWSILVVDFRVAPPNYSHSIFFQRIIRRKRRNSGVFFQIWRFSGVYFSGVFSNVFGSFPAY